MRRDSNPRYISAQRFSRPPPSATRSLILISSLKSLMRFVCIKSEVIYTLSWRKSSKLRSKMLFFHSYSTENQNSRGIPCGCPFFSVSVVCFHLREDCMYSSLCRYGVVIGPISAMLFVYKWIIGLLKGIVSK